MIMAMAIPAFAAADEVAPCAICNGNHTYEEAAQQVSYSCGLNGCVRTTITHYKCVYCSSIYVSTPVSTTVAHNYQKIGTTSDGGVVYKCSRCSDVKTLY